MRNPISSLVNLLDGLPTVTVEEEGQSASLYLI